jgi:uncharacterized tellurite resistance protein B-like protein
MNMLGNIRRFFASLPLNEQQSFAPDDHRVMAAALLVHVMTIDGIAADKERQKLAALVKSGFGLSDAETAELIAEAERRDREAVDLYGFTSLIKRALDEDGRARLIEMLWDMAFADGKVDEFEYNVIWRIAELIGISGRNRVLLQQKVKARG